MLVAPMGTVFDKILSGELPCHKVWEDDAHLAFLDVSPRCVGHTLVIPKRAHDYVFTLDERAYAALWTAARHVADKLTRVLGATRVCIAVHGWEVRHVHVHLFPTKTGQDVPFPPVDPAAKAALAETARLLAP
jgi:histidine triad (HIT) family protein